MRVLIVERAGDGLLDIAIRAQLAGHQVRMFIRDFDPVKRPIGKGFVELVPDWRTWIRWCDLCLLGSNDLYMVEMARWRAEGVPIIGFGNGAEEWEIDRARGQQVFRKAGIETLPYRSFKSYDQAIAYVKAEERPFACKPSGKCDDKSLSYVAKEPDDLIWTLERWKKAGKRAGQEFILQEKVSGVEMGVGAWFGPGGFAAGWEENWEFKKLMPGDLGPNTGELGTVLRYVRSSKLANKVLKPLEEQLDAAGYTGNIDVNCIIDDRGNAWPLEFTMRFGYPAINIEEELFGGDPIEFWAALAASEPVRQPHVLDEIAIGFCVVLPPYPAPGAYTDVVGVPLTGEDEHFHAVEMMAGKDGCLSSAGTYCGLVTATGATVAAARRTALARLDRLKMPGSPFWRDDVGRRLATQLPELQRHGYATGMEYRN